MSETKQIYQTGCLTAVLAFVAVFAKGFLVGEFMHGDKGFVIALVFAGIITLFGVFTKWSAKEDQSELQTVRDKYPIEELELLQYYHKKGLSLPIRDYRLFLRPFLTIQKIKINNPDFPHNFFLKLFHHSESEPQPAYLNFEFILARLLEISSNNKMYALGGDLKEPSPGRAFLPDDDWKSNFELFAKAAHSIIIIPGYTPSTMWEIEWLKTNFLLDKTIFIMPGHINKDESFNITQFWDKTIETLSDIGIELPKYQYEGLLFKMNAYGKLTRKQPLSLVNFDKFVENLNILEEPY